jgi:hypothetical protein
MLHEMGIPLYYIRKKNYKLKELQLEKVIHRKICISKEYILIHFDSTTITTYCNIAMQGTDSNLRRVSSESSGSSNRRHNNWTRRISRSIEKNILWFYLVYLIIYIGKLFFCS